MNKAILIGRLTKNPELKTTANGKSITRFTIAVNRPMNREEADFITCVAFDKRAEAISQYMSRGSQIAIVGQITTGSYEKNGQTIYTTDVFVNEFEFVSAGKNNNSNNNSKPTQTNGNNYDDMLLMDGDEEGDIPF